MEITLSPVLTQTIADFKIGLVSYRGITVSDSPQMLHGRLQLFQESLYFDLLETPLAEQKGIQEWRSIFKTFGKDPNRYRPSSEALLRRVQKQQYLSTIHSAVDLNNFFSLQYQIPIGLYDADQFQGDVMIRVGEEDESFHGLNGRENQAAQLIISADSAGPFGSPFVDSKRTAVTTGTKNALHIVYLSPSLPEESSHQLIESLGSMFQQLHGGDFQTAILTADSSQHTFKT
ncbi:DNA/RNA-binding domain of Phe-tRNA-synthetase-like protein [Bacillus oleivorans]|uniref:DNA/RNA-binding domain of Phe-tRNA-synthetase-like protein n=1 Tax=Bacillus oleivorans TaxID=1448271 RepID=A0A285CQI6_9BACI|nr:phenylalanine--tRNA ligase beta subunit-related protein [Bacillus oleivorans]SNX69817.1 DNA/RNA-binding domain of Phe-tRNA-synthetase-like protein [Bacillus oleivorans]